MNKYLIEIAIDKSTGNLLKSEEIFSNKKKAFAFRRQCSLTKDSHKCCECDQDLIVSSSAKERIHFKHKPGHKYCVLSSKDISFNEKSLYIKTLIYKESDRHKTLKNIIGKRLEKEKGIDISSISIDSKFIVRGDNKRRPDVYCKYYDKELVFEIQLSDLSQRYILERHTFYQRYGIYLIWILDDFDIHSQDRLEKDIKYLNQHQNYFKPHELNDLFLLECNYKSSFITESGKLLEKWHTRSISLNQLHFDDINFQVYHYNYPEKKALKERERQILEEQNIKLAEEKAEILESEEAISAVDNILRNIRNNKQRNNKYKYDCIAECISKLEKKRIEILNQKCNLQRVLNDGTTPIIKWIDDPVSTIEFINFILGAKEILFDVNQTDAKQRTVFQAILQNKKLSIFYLRENLFKRGYMFTVSDAGCISSKTEYSENIESTIYFMCNSLTSKYLINTLFKHEKLIYIIESAIRNEITGVKYNNWISFANYVIQFYGDYWEKYLKPIFEVTGLLTKIVQEDKNKTFANKLKKLKVNYSDSECEKDIEIIDLIDDLYQESLYVYQYEPK